MPYQAEIERIQEQLKANPGDEGLKDELRELRRLQREAIKN